MTTSLDVKPATGKLGILTPGMGAVSSTFMAGVIAVRKGIRLPIGSTTQLGHIRLGKRTDNRQPLIKNFVPLTELENIVFGGWDIFEDSIYDASITAGVLPKDLLDEIKDELSAIKPMPAVFDNYYVKKLEGTHVKQGANKLELAEQLMADMATFKTENGCDRLVMIWCGSTEIFMKPSDVHQTIEAFENGLRNNHPDIAPSMIYAYAAIKMGVPYANGAPNLSADFPALEQLSHETGTPTMGKDFKTGQTLMKTILAPGFKARLLGINGWFSTNILGNRDGEVLDDPESFKTKEESKLSVLDTILQPELYPDLYGDLYHKVRINYYPPRGD
ncbi:MAG: inositol-3-phosphate synthase, partial [Ardenticatenia bacterium]|nr:inositol-3-phosphate synthase [Ardenticatenia bacterium]